MMNTENEHDPDYGYWIAKPVFKFWSVKENLKSNYSVDL